ncbi:hypothetical protein [Actinoplanes awajinensis]|uniref:Uncharacterized protein n=1 Tax=Actinoplanes awajinensis subsp. mycoplanecinus TaxID=135947 RepID=A0A0X3V2Z8_9ACTN|nr:hypothetical protein [Actinoplanes awajinensis]KUL39110.1 hypothetical protein ADL15_10220 [Actinoplanes awajinensis subsp. mycoplanecinus]
MTTNATDQVRTITPDELRVTGPSRLRQAVTTVRTSRPAQKVSAHRKPATATLLALAGVATAALLYLRKRNARPAPSRWRSALRRS